MHTKKIIHTMASLPFIGRVVRFVVALYRLPELQARLLEVFKIQQQQVENFTHFYSELLSTQSRIIKVNNELINEIRTKTELLETKLVSEYWYYPCTRNNGRLNYTKRVPINPSPNIFPNSILKHDEHVIFDIDKAINLLGVNKIAIVFFCGLGDFLMGTPVLKKLVEKYNHIKWIAYVSKDQDGNNSKYLDVLVRGTGLFNDIRYFHGLPSGINWRSYDYSEIFHSIDSSTLLLPFIYEYDINIRSRFESLCITYSLPVPTDTHLHLPWLPSNKRCKIVDDFVQKICNVSNFARNEKIVFVHFDTRSSSYKYAHSATLINKLLAQKVIVVSATPLGIEHDLYFEINLNNFSILDSIAVIEFLAARFSESFSAIVVPSVFWVVLAMFKINTLALMHRHDFAVHNYWYSNIHLISFFDPIAIPKSHLTVFDDENYTFNSDGWCDYNPDIICNLWEDKFSH